MHARVLKELKDITYGFVKNTYNDVSYVKNNQTFHTGTNPYDDTYYYQGKWHYTTYRTYYAYCNVKIFNLTEFLTNVKNSDAFLAPSDDSSKETLLHYFLRTYYVLPNTHNYSFKDHGFKDSKEKYEAAVFHQLSETSRTSLCDLVATTNRKIANEILAPAFQELTTDNKILALSIKNAEGDTPLHLAASIPIGSGIFARLQVILNEVQSFNDDQKLLLLELLNDNNETILDCAAKNENPQILEAILKAFGHKLVIDFICNTENKFLENLITNKAASIIFILNNLCLNQEAKNENEESKEVPLTIPQKFLSSVSNGNRNFLHMACRKLRFDQDDRPDTTIQLIQKVLTLLNEEKQKDNALVSVTSNGWNPLHYLCRSGKVSQFEFLNDAQPSIIYKGLSAQNNRGFTPLHYICQYGNSSTLKNIFKKLDKDCPGAKYYLIKQHEVALKALAKKNKNSSKFEVRELENILTTFQINNKALCNLLDTYRYLDQRSKSSVSQKDYLDRENDFLEQLEGFIASLSGKKSNTYSFTANSKFMIQSSCCFFQRYRSQHYYNHMERLANSSGSLTLKTFKEFKAFLESQEQNSLTRALLAKLNELPTESLNQTPANVHNAADAPPPYVQTTAPTLTPSSPAQYQMA